MSPVSKELMDAMLKLGQGQPDRSGTIHIHGGMTEIDGVMRLEPGWVTVAPSDGSRIKTIPSVKVEMIEWDDGREA